LNAEEQDERAKLSLKQGEVSDTVKELRVKALRMLRVMIGEEELVGVKLFKMKLLSNLLSYTYPPVSERGVYEMQMRREISLIVEHFLNN
jgi:hypothetical protein